MSKQFGNNKNSGNSLQNVQQKADALFKITMDNKFTNRGAEESIDEFNGRKDREQSHAGIFSQGLVTDFKCGNIGGSFKLDGNEEWFNAYVKAIDVGVQSTLVERSLVDKGQPEIIRLDFDFLVDPHKHMTDGKKHCYHTLPTPEITISEEAFAEDETDNDFLLKKYDVPIKAVEDVLSCLFTNCESELRKNETFTVWFFEREMACSNVDENGYMKDGLHVLIPEIKIARKFQRYIRKEVCEDVVINGGKKFQGMKNLADLNNYELERGVGITNVGKMYDESVIKNGNWFLLGSAKPGKTPYVPCLIVEYTAITKGNAKMSMFTKGCYTWQTWRDDGESILYKGISTTGSSKLTVREEMLYREINYLSIRNVDTMYCIKLNPNERCRRALDHFEHVIKRLNVRKPDEDEETSEDDFSFSSLRDILVNQVSLERSSNYDDWKKVAFYLVDRAIYEQNTDADSEEIYLSLLHEFSARSANYARHKVDDFWQKKYTTTLNSGRKCDNPVRAGTFINWANTDNPNRCIMNDEVPDNLLWKATEKVATQIAQNWPTLRTADTIQLVRCIVSAFECLDTKSFQNAIKADVIHRAFYIHLHTLFKPLWLIFIKYFNINISVKKWTRTDVTCPHTGRVNSVHPIQTKFDVGTFLNDIQPFCDATRFAEFSVLCELAMDIELVKPDNRGIPTGVLFTSPSHKQQARVIMEMVSGLCKGRVHKTITRDAAVLAFGDSTMQTDSRVHSLWSIVQASSLAGQLQNSINRYIAGALERVYERIITYGLGGSSEASTPKEFDTASNVSFISGNIRQKARALIELLSDYKSDEGVADKIKMLKKAPSLFEGGHLTQSDLAKLFEAAEKLLKVYDADSLEFWKGDKKNTKKAKNVHSSEAAAVAELHITLKTHGNDYPIDDIAYLLTDILSYKSFRFNDEREVRTFVTLYKIFMEEMVKTNFQLKHYAEPIDNLAKISTGFLGYSNKELLNKIDNLAGIHCFKNCVIDDIDSIGRPIIRVAKQSDLVSTHTGFDLRPPSSIACETKRRFDMVMAQIIPDDESRNYLYTQLGCVMTTRKPINEAMIVLIGKSAANGKSTLFKFIERAFGEFNTTVSSNVLFDTDKKGNGNGATPEFVKFASAKIAGIHEATSENIFNSQATKQLTGGDPMTCRALFCDPQIVHPHALLMVICNSIPRVPDATDAGMQRRLVFINCPSRFVNDKVYEDLMKSNGGRAPDNIHRITTFTPDEIQDFAMCLTYVCLKAFTSWEASCDGIQVAPLSIPSQSAKISKDYFTTASPIAMSVQENFSCLPDYVPLYKALRNVHKQDESATFQNLLAKFNLAVDAVSATGVTNLDIRKRYKLEREKGTPGETIQTVEAAIRRMLGYGLITKQGRCKYPGIISNEEASANYPNAMLLSQVFAIGEADDYERRNIIPIKMSEIITIADANLRIEDSLNKPLGFNEKDECCLVTRAVECTSTIFIPVVVDTSKLIPREEPMVPLEMLMTQLTEEVLQNQQILNSNVTKAPVPDTGKNILIRVIYSKKPFTDIILEGGSIDDISTAVTLNDLPSITSLQESKLLEFQIPENNGKAPLHPATRSPFYDRVLNYALLLVAKFGKNVVMQEPFNKVYKYHMKGHTVPVEDDDDDMEITSLVYPGGSSDDDDHMSITSLAYPSEDETEIENLVEEVETEEESPEDVEVEEESPVEAEAEAEVEEESPVEAEVEVEEESHVEAEVEAEVEEDDEDEDEDIVIPEVDYEDPDPENCIYAECDERQWIDEELHNPLLYEYAQGEFISMCVDKRERDRHGLLVETPEEMDVVSNIINATTFSERCHYINNRYITPEEAHKLKHMIRLSKIIEDRKLKENCVDLKKRTLEYVNLVLLDVVKKNQRRYDIMWGFRKKAFELFNLNAVDVPDIYKVTRVIDSETGEERDGGLTDEDENNNFVAKHKFQLEVSQSGLPSAIKQYLISTVKEEFGIEMCYRYIQREKWLQGCYAKLIADGSIPAVTKVNLEPLMSKWQALVNKDSKAREIERKAMNIVKVEEKFIKFNEAWVASLPYEEMKPHIDTTLAHMRMTKDIRDRKLARDEELIRTRGYHR